MRSIANLGKLPLLAQLQPAHLGTRGAANLAFPLVDAMTVLPAGSRRGGPTFRPAATPRERKARHQGPARLQAIPFPVALPRLREGSPAMRRVVITGLGVVAPNGIGK